MVHRALVSAEAIARWRVPPGVRSEVHEFEARKGSRFLVSLTYDAPGAPGTPGKSAERTATGDGGAAVPAADNEAGSRRAPARLTRFVGSGGADSA